MLSNVDKNIVTQLWNTVTVTVNRFTEVIKIHDKNTFLGYVDITLESRNTLPDLKLKIPGIGVRVLKGKPYLCMPGQKGECSKYSPRPFPLSGELRAVITLSIFKQELIMSSIERAAAIAHRGENHQDNKVVYDNPFYA